MSLWGGKMLAISGLQCDTRATNGGFCIYFYVGMGLLKVIYLFIASHKIVHVGEMGKAFYK